MQTIDLPHSRHGIAAYYLIATAEASSNLARYDGVRYGVRAAGDGRTVASMYESTRGTGFGAEVKRRIMLGTYVLSAGYYDAYYLKAQQVRTLIGSDYEAAFEKVDVIALPTSPTGAFPLGERTSDPVLMYLADVFTVGANLAGVPAITVPCGFTDAQLPVGLQFTARKMDEATLLQVAGAYQHATDWHERRPLRGTLTGRRQKADGRTSGSSAFACSLRPSACSVSSQPDRVGSGRTRYQSSATRRISGRAGMSTPKISAIAPRRSAARAGTNGTASSAMSPPNSSFNRSRGSIRIAPSTQNTRRTGSRTTQKMAFSDGREGDDHGHNRDAEQQQRTQLDHRQPVRPHRSWRPPP